MSNKWKISAYSTLCKELSRKLSISPAFAQLLINRGVRDENSAIGFIYPRLSSLPDPTLLPDIETAAELICKTIYQQQPITIYGDYDADGLTGACLLYYFFHELGVPCHVYIPNRLTQGYGLHGEVVRKVAERRGGTLITVDCGVSNMKEVALAMGLGMNVVVTDHHRVSADSHFICPVINPNRPDSMYPENDMAGVAVAFLLAVAVRSRLREKGYFKIRREPELKDFLDLVAVGTVADQVPLLGLNRVFVYHGLERLRNSRWKGLRALVQASAIDPQHITSRDIAFRIGPRLNAPGRIDSAEICMHMLVEKDEDRAEHLVSKVNEANSRRQALERAVLNDITKTIQEDSSALNDKVLIFGRERWHEGVLGIAASKLVDLYSRPALVIAFQGEIAKGSGRSIEKFNLYDTMSKVGSIFDRFGGHAHAAGFSLKRSRFREFREKMLEMASNLLADEDLTPVLHIEAEISFKHISRNLIKNIESLAPFGNGNPEPLFCTRAVQVLESRIVGEEHLRLVLREQNKVYPAIGFGMSKSQPKPGSLVDIVYTPQFNCWQGYETIQLKLEDLKVHGT